MSIDPISSTHLVSTPQHFLFIEGVTGPTPLPAAIGVGGPGFQVLSYDIGLGHIAQPARAGLFQGTSRITLDSFRVIILANETTGIFTTFLAKKPVAIKLVLTQKVGDAPTALFSIDATNVTIIGYKNTQWIKAPTPQLSFVSDDDLEGPDVPDFKKANVVVIDFKPQGTFTTTYSATDITSTAEGSIATGFNFATGVPV